ncbi:MAG: transporter substrate-binding domain-containing protein, partial [Hyphomicrobiales bacterium]
MSNKILPLVLGAAMGVAASTAAGATTLEDVKAKGSIQCGVSQGLPGFSNPDSQGNWTGLDVDFCRAMAAAVFGDAYAVKFTPLSAKERFTALQSGEIDVLSRNTTWTMSRDTQLGLNFAGVNYYDGQGFMVRKDLGVTSALEMSGASVCTNTGTTTELNVADYFRANNMPYEI